MTLRTRRNFDVAMHGEAFAAAKYKRFAAFARTNENNGLAKLLTEVADESRIGHFAKEVQLAGLISDDIANLRDVVRDKRYAICGRGRARWRPQCSAVVQRIGSRR